MAKKVSRSARKQQTQTVEVRFGKVTFLSPDKGALVELLTDQRQSAAQQRSMEVFIPKELIANKLLSKNKMVQVTRSGNTILEVKHF